MADRHVPEYVPVPFGEWLPDQPPMGLAGVVTATNVIPDANSYRPFPSLVTYATGVAGRCRGGIVATNATDVNYNYVGDASALYALVGVSFSACTRAGGAYTLATNDFWEFVQWGNTVIGVNGHTDLPQQISLGATTFADLSSGVKAKHIAVMRDFVVMGNVSDSAANVYRVRWSAINNPTSWTVDAATLADYQDLPSEGGHIQKVLGGEFGVVLQQKSVWRMLFVGSPIIFQFDRVHSNIGAYVPQAAIRYQNVTYFLAEDGFYAFDGSEVLPIGRGKVDRFFLSNVDVSYINRTHAYIDAPNKLVMWAYSSGANADGNPDRLLLYSWAFNRWALVTGLNIEYLISGSTGGTGGVSALNMDNMDSVHPSLDNITVSFDDAIWGGSGGNAGTTIVAAAFNAAHALATFNGSAMAATIETGEFQLFPDSRAMVEEVRPQVDGLSASASVLVINRNNLTESASVGGVATFPNVTGFCQFRVDARYFRVRLVTTAATEFLHLIGVEVKGVPTGRR